jgi:hypothetical protein
MFSRTARLAGLLAIVQGAVGMALPAKASASSRFQCGDSGVHVCCIFTTCTYCCVIDGNGNLSDCGCQNQS